MLTDTQRIYFDNLTPGTIIQLSQAKDPTKFKEAIFDYIDLYGHSIGFIQDYQSIIKYSQLPINPQVNYFFNY